MKIGLISDTHDNVDAAKEAVNVFEENGVDKIFHLGDISSYPIIEFFPKDKSYFIFGNCDVRELQDFLVDKGYNASNSYDLKFDGQRMFFIHGDNRLFVNRMINDGLFDVVFHGHTHRRQNIKRNNTLIINPGALKEGTISVNKTICIYDTESSDVEFIKID
ncbi:MAG: metallophosphoesterase family protein [archaeon]